MYLGDSDIMKSQARRSGRRCSGRYSRDSRFCSRFLPIGLADSKMFQHSSERKKPGVNATETTSRLRNSRAIAKGQPDDRNLHQVIEEVTAVVKKASPSVISKIFLGLDPASAERRSAQ